VKLRFRKNSLRFRVNRPEVEDLAAGHALEERVYFPGDTSIRYVLEISGHSSPRASFENGTIRVAAPSDMVRQWAENDVIGIYFELAANGAQLDISIEKDLECLERVAEERDPDAFRRASKNC
jgi:hypothetical protein